MKLLIGGLGLDELFVAGNMAGDSATMGTLVQAIVPAAKLVQGNPGDFADNTDCECAMRTATRIATKSSIVAGLIKSGNVKVLAGRYDLEDGRVEFFN